MHFSLLCIIHDIISEIEFLLADIIRRRGMRVIVLERLGINRGKRRKKRALPESVSVWFVFVDCVGLQCSMSSTKSCKSTANRGITAALWGLLLRNKRYSPAAAHWYYQDAASLPTSKMSIIFGNSPFKPSNAFPIMLRRSCDSIQKL